jgi:hypothetical protein
LLFEHSLIDLHCSVGGKIKVIRESDDMFFGWIEKSSISYKGIYGTWKITSDVSEALDVSFSAPADGTPFDVVQVRLSYRHRQRADADQHVAWVEPVVPLLWRRR